MFNRKAANKTTIDSLINSATRLEGNISFNGGLRIDGQVRGDVVSGDELGGLLVIGEHGRVDGHVAVEHLIVNGTIQGTITVAGTLELQPKARINGEIRYRAIEVHPGAVVEGIVSRFDGELVRPDLRLSKEGRPGAVTAAPALPLGTSAPAGSRSGG